MTRKIGKIIIRLIIFLIFVATATFSLLFAKGFRFDAKEREFIHTGILDISSIPLGVAIFINNEFRGFTPDFLRGVPTGSLELRLEKGGFRYWEKKVNIDEEIITKIYPVIIPTNPTLFIKEIANSRNVLLDRQERGIVMYNPDLKTLHTIDFITEKEEVRELDKKADRLFFDKKGELLIKYGAKSESLKIFNSNEELPPLPISKENPKLSINGDNLLIIRGNSLWKYNTETSESWLVKEFDEKIVNAYWFPESRSIITYSDNNIFLLDADGENFAQLFTKDPSTSVYLLANSRKLIWQDKQIWRQFSFLEI